MRSFEDRLAEELGLMAGPEPPVDALAVARSVAAQAPKRRFQTMFSATRFVLASVIVALFGGFLLAGVLTTQDPQGPAAGESASPTPAPTTGTGGRAFTTTPNVPYMTIGDRQAYLDIYTPKTEGPWPVVVAFHAEGRRDHRSTYNVATAAATEGMLVFTPTWLESSALPLTPELGEQARNQGHCAIAFAQQQAAELGGDPDRTVAYGWLAGSTPAMAAGLAPAEGPIPGCATDAPAIPVSGVVAGDGDYLQYTAFFDQAFAGDEAEMQAQGAALFDPSGWPQDMDTRFFLWTAGDGVEQRPDEDLPDLTSLLEQRDPTGSLLADLERLGQLDDGVITTLDAARLMADRLSAEGLEATLDELPGDATTLDKVPELVGYMQAAAGE